MKTCFCLILSLLLILPLTAKQLPLKTVGLKFLANFAKVKPKLNHAYMSGPSRTIIDDEGFVYICEGEKHRVLKFSQYGRFIKQIGRIGQDDEGLYHPGGIFIKEKTLFILDDIGKKIKTFTLDGQLLSAAKLNANGIYWSTAIVVDDSKIYTNSRFRSKDWKDKKLISVFSKEGKLLNSFGRSSIADRIQAYWIGNEVYLSIYNGKLYGVFETSPVIFSYDLKGKELLFTDIRSIEIDDEIDAIYKLYKDPPDDSPNPNKVLSRTYFFGFSIDKRGNYQLVINYHIGGKRKAFIFVLDRAGNPQQKIRFTSGEKPVYPIFNIIRNRKGAAYIVGCKLGSTDYCLFRWKQKNTKNIVEDDDESNQ